MDSNYSLADIRAATEGDNDGLGGSWWLIILFLAMMGGGGFGWGGNGRNDIATATTQQEILFGQQFQRLDDRITNIGNGISDAAFALTNQISNEARGIQMQNAECCCETRLGIANLGAAGDRHTCEITNAIHAEGEATRALIRENEIQALRDKVGKLELNEALCGVVRYPQSITYGAGMSPYFGGGNHCCCGSNI